MTREGWVVVDLGFGDAGKGATTDFLVRDRGATLVVRFNGGAQAGHNVVTADGRHHTFSQLGSGTFVPGVGTHLGPAFLLHPGGLWVEARHLARKGVPDALARLTVDASARLVTPFHQAGGRLRELLRGEGAHGTCGVGIGEAVLDTARDDALCAADLRDPARIRAHLLRQQERKRAELAAARGLADPRAEPELALLDDPGAVERIVAAWVPLAELRVLEPDAAARRIASAPVVVAEGAQGVLLDETWGFHPHTTWSDCTPRGALALLADRPVTRIGVIRAYATRHGPGPFPTDGTLPLSEPHNDELGWAGRFRTGALDLPLLRYAARVCGGVDAVALTCLDRVPDPLPVGIAHQDPPILDPGAEDDLAAREALGRRLAEARPVIEWIPRSELPERVAEAASVPVRLTAHGPRAEDRRWAGGITNRTL